MPTKEERFLGRIKNEIYAYFDINYDRAIPLKQLYKAFALRDVQLKKIYESMVDELVHEQKLVKQPNGSYQIYTNHAYREGRIEHVNARFAFVVVDGEAKDVFIDAHDLNGAMDGDTVKIAVWKGSKRKDFRPEGEVLEVVERKRQEIVGTIDVKTKYALVTPDSRRIYQRIFIPQTALAGATTGDKVIVKITHWVTDIEEDLEGEVVRILGKAGEHQTEMHAILAEFGLPSHFPEEINVEANAIPENILDTEIAKRRDMRGILTFTIDPADAKDFDDALSIQYLKNGNIEIGVHIADVSHYVRPNTGLDKEAFRRGTSVYLVDRVVPMLPEKLSNNLCSLRPHEDKLTFSAIFELDTHANIHKQWFGRTVIHSDQRFAYEEAQVLLETMIDEDEPINPLHQALVTLNQLALKLRAERFAKGAINFETVEVKFLLDENGTPLSVYQKERKDAHKLIEEFMLLANKKVAEYVYNLSKKDPHPTMVYRIHEAPNIEKLKSFSQFVRKFGYQLKVSEENLQVANALNGLMTAVEGRPEQNILESLAIRTMAKARYSTEETGHFGLAFQHYSHFTSPIRRYPDVIAHRLLQHYLDKGVSVERAKVEGECKFTSDRERVAAEAERASIKYKQVEFMSLKDKTQVFEGVISGLTEFGMFVEIKETACEGLVRMTDLPDDYYELDQENYRIVGKRNGKVFTFGDVVSVQIKECNLAKRSMDLLLIDKRGGRTGNRKNMPSRNKEKGRRK
jgi:ribonuclease R